MTQFRCSRKVFEEADIEISHEATVKQIRQGYVGKVGQKAYVANPSCGIYNLTEEGFRKLRAHSDDEVDPMQGVIPCPHCKAKLGRYSWVGLNCSCGAFITPAFLIPKSKVDKEIPLAAEVIQQFGRVVYD